MRKRGRKARRPPEAKRRRLRLRPDGADGSPGAESVRVPSPSPSRAVPPDPAWHGLVPTAAAAFMPPPEILASMAERDERGFEILAAVLASDPLWTFGGGSEDDLVERWQHEAAACGFLAEGFWGEGPVAQAMQRAALVDGTAAVSALLACGVLVEVQAPRRPELVSFMDEGPAVEVSWRVLRLARSGAA